MAASDTLAALSIVDPVVTGMIVGAPAEQPLIHERLAPITPITGVGESYTYPVFGREAMRAPLSSVRALGGASRRIRWSLSSNSGVVTEHSLYAALDEREVEAANGFDLRAEVAMIPYGQIKTEKEKALATLVMTAGNHDSNHTRNNFSFASGNVPVEIEAEAQLIKRKTGYRPNQIMIPSLVWAVVAENSYVLAKMNTYVDKIVTPERLGAMLSGVIGSQLEVIIGDSVYMDEVDVTSTGGGTAGTDIWGDGVLMQYVNPIVSKRNPSFTRMFQKPYGGTMGEVRRAVDTDNNELIFYKERYQPKICYKEAAFLWANADQA